MKKVIALLTGLVLISSIIIVAFFGTLAYTKEKNIYCDYITLINKNEMKDTSVAIEYLTRPDDKDIKAGDDWFDNDYNYRINVRDFDYVKSSTPSKRVNEIPFQCYANTLRPGKVVTDDKLNYYVNEPENYNDYFEDLTKIQSNRAITIKPNAFIKGSIKPFTIKVQSNDPKGKFIKVRLQVKVG